MLVLESGQTGYTLSAARSQVSFSHLSKLFRNVTCFNSLEMSHSFFSFLRQKPSSRSCGNCEKLGAAFLRRVFQTLVGKWENMQFVFPLFHMRGSFHSFPLWATAIS